MSEVNKKPEMVTAFAYENALMHKDFDNARSTKTTWFVCITFIIITLIFVFAYTVRMNAFIETINKLTAEIVELAGAKDIISP